MPTCLLVRHGHSTANASGILAGWTPDIPLDEQGREQVAALARRLAALPLAAVVTSPLLRCRETADAIVAAAGLPSDALVVAEDLGECRYGAWTGRTLKELSDEPLWRIVQDNPSAARFPDSDAYAGESMAGMAHRAVAAVREHDERVGSTHGEDALWVAVTHGDMIKAVLADAAGAHLDQFQRFTAAPASLSAVRYTARRPFVLCSNDAGADLRHLQPNPSPEAPTGDAVVGGGADGRTA